MIKKENIRITITISKELYYKILKESKKENRSLSNYISNKLSK